jgi:hypothetical protein
MHTCRSQHSKTSVAVQCWWFSISLRQCRRLDTLELCAAVSGQYKRLYGNNISVLNGQIKYTIQTQANYQLNEIFL